MRCPLCGRGFSKQTALRSHMLMHAGEKEHKKENTVLVMGIENTEQGIQNKGQKTETM